MEKIVKNLHTPTPDCCLLIDIAEQLDEKTGILSDSIIAIIDEQIAECVDDFSCKAASAIKEAAKALIDGDEVSAAKYRGIAEGLCYSIECLIGLPFDISYIAAIHRARKF